MSTLLSNITSVVNEAIAWMTSFVGAITATGNELLLLFAVIPVVGLGVGILRRMIKID